MASNDSKKPPARPKTRLATASLSTGKRGEPGPDARRDGVIDVIAHDPATDRVVLVMNEFGEWDGTDERLHDLQERFNAYVSFLLDGELAETYPELAGKRARIEVRCRQMPDVQTIDLLGMIHDQLAFQGIEMEVVVKEMTNDE